MTPTLAAQSPPMTRSQMHEELFADDALSTPNDGSFAKNDGLFASNDGAFVPEDRVSDWIDEARKEALQRKSSRDAVVPLENELLSEDSLEGESPEFIDQLIAVEAAGLPAIVLSQAIDNSDEKLFLLYQNGDDRAFFAIYDRYKSDIYAYCAHVLFSVGLSREAVEDTFQDVFLRLVQYRHTFAGGDFRRWLFTVTRHSCLSAKKLGFRQSAGIEYAGDTENFDESISGDPRAELARGDDPLEHMAKSEQTKLLLEAIARLPDEFREALVLSEYEGLTYDEIGRMTNTSLSTIRIRIFRAKARLRKMLLPVIGDNPGTNGKKLGISKV
jgi:RNA polymerase sigma-70 factor (ECF subfamily)